MHTLLKLGFFNNNNNHKIKIKNSDSKIIIAIIRILY